MTHKRYVVRHGGLLHFWSRTFWNQLEISTLRLPVQKLWLKQWFMILAILTFDLCSIICHTHWALCTGISMRICIRIGKVLMGDMPRTQTNKHKHTETHTKCKINSLIARLTRQSEMADLARRATRWVGTFPYILTPIPNLYDHSFPRYGQITFLTFRRPWPLT